MFKARLIALFACFASSILLIVSLYFVSRWMSIYPNNFLRKLPSHKIEGLGFTKFRDKNLYIAGGDQKTIYFGSWSNRSHVLWVNIGTKDTGLIKISGFDTVKFTKVGFVKADSSFVYIFDGSKPALFSGDVRSGKLTKRYWLPYFTAAEPLPDGAYALKVVLYEQNALVKVKGREMSKPYFLEKQGDGIFSTDGMLLMTPNKSKAFYVYYYRNQFLCLDTNLNLQYKGKTIDTVSHSHIQIAPIKSMHELTLSAPPLYVNKQCAVNDSWLFIHSALKADNEVDSAMGHVATIDVYSVKDGKYSFSFYLNDFDGEKMREFRVYGNKLIALYSHYLYVYKLHF